MTEWSSCEHRRARGGWAEDAALGRCSWPIGPRNTWSNGAYLLAGLVVLDQGAVRATAGVMCAALFALGLGSAMYHAEKTLLANRLDHVGMYLTFGALSVHGFAPLHPAMPWTMAVTGFTLAAFLAIVIPKVSLDLQMGVLLWYSAVPAMLGGDLKLAFASWAVFVVAFVCWQLDKHRVWWIGLWGHALWHLLTAAAIAMMFLAQGGVP